MTVLLVLVALTLVSRDAVPAARRAHRILRGDGGDRARWLLICAVGRLPPNRTQWGQAMLVELDRITGSRERWGFTLGCARTALALRISATQTHVRATIAAASAVIGAAWLGVVHPTHALRAWVAVPLAVALLAPVAVALIVRRQCGDRRSAAAAGAWAGLGGGLITFVVLTASAYLRDGRPYDAQLIRDFNHSGAHDLAGYAIQSDLGVAFSLLLLIPLASAALARFPTARVAAGRAPE